MNTLNARPDLITFIYGPINSGKTELLYHLVKRLPNDYRIVYINLRGVYVSKADDFLKILFKVRERKKRVKKVIEVGIESISEIAVPAIPIPRRLFTMFFEDGEIENVFRYLELFFINLSKRYRPVLIIDELQKIWRR